jgi:hypothetical protein
MTQAFSSWPLLMSDHFLSTRSQTLNPYLSLKMRQFYAETMYVTKANVDVFQMVYTLSKKKKVGTKEK